MNNKLLLKNEIQQRIENNQLILGMEVIGIDGCQPPYKGVVRELSVYDHSVLGILVQVWVEWFYAEYPKGHIEPYFPKQFKKYSGQREIGVYVV